MLKLTRTWQPTEPGTEANPSARPERRIRAEQSLEASTRLIVTVMGLVFISAVGWFNLHAVKGLSFDFFYLFACAAVGWISGTTEALMCAALSCILIYFAEAPAAELSSKWIVLGNSFIRLLAFGGTGWLAGRFGGHARNLELTIQQRTQCLQKEIEEHKETSELLVEGIQISRHLTDNIADVFWVTDPLKQRFEYVSPGFETVWGKSCSALCASASAWLEGIHHEDRDRVMHSIFTKQIRGDYDEEYRVVRSDGAIRWVHDRAFPVKDQNGAVYRIVGITEDITERKRTEQLVQAERDMGMALSSTSNLGFALERFLEIAMQLEGIDCGGVYLMSAETGELHLEAHRGLSGSFLTRISHYKADATETRIARSGKVTYVGHEQIPRSLEVLWGSEGLRALAVVPVRHKDEALGLLTLGSYRMDEIAPRTRVGIELIASQVAGAIARIRAEELQRRSEAHLRTIINSAPIALLAVDAQGRISFEDGRALSAMGIKTGQHVGCFAKEVYQDFPLMLANIEKALGGEELSSVLEFDSTVFECRYTPLRDKNSHPAGFIAVATDITERARLQREILEISDREQARIGQDVHDGLCQQLIGMAFSANSLERALSSLGRAEAAVAGKLCTLLDGAIDESRRVCRGLYPIRLSTHGLQNALEELAGAVQERYGVQCICEPDGESPACDLATATHLYRIAQEAVNNAGKHSGARRISIHLGRVPEGVLLEVRDDGKGVGQLSASSSSSRSSGGMGLHIMKYRASVIGGELNILSEPSGTIVSCRVPRTL